MGCIKLSILDEQYKRTEIRVSSPQKELTSVFFVVTARRASLYAYCSNNPVSKIDPTGLSDGWIDDGNGNVFWDNNTNSQEEFNTNYANKPGYSYASDPNNPNSYTLPSGEGSLVMNTWVAPNDISNGSGGVHINISFIPTGMNAEVGWLQTYSSNMPDGVHSGNLYDLLPTTGISSERLDGAGKVGVPDASQAGYYGAFRGSMATLDDGPQRAKNPGAQWDVSFNAQSTVLVNGNRTVSLGWGFTVNSENHQTINAPTILKTTSGFHNKAVNSLGNKIRTR